MLPLIGLVLPLKSLVFPYLLIKCNLNPPCQRVARSGLRHSFWHFLGGYGGVGPGGVEPEKCDLARSWVEMNTEISLFRTKTT